MHSSSKGISLGTVIIVVVLIGLVTFFSKL